MKKVKVIAEQELKEDDLINDALLYHGDVLECIKQLPDKPLFDMVITSPPYNIGKEYEKKLPLDEYISFQEKVIQEIDKRMKPDGSICWEVGNYVNNNSIIPLDYLFDPIFRKLGYTLRNRIVWHYGHGLNNKYRFSGRYEVILWYTKGKDYKFNLDDVRIPAKYPNKKYSKGEKKGQLSGDPKGKNPEDVWDIPNVKSNHVEKTDHPCQFPVGLVERLILALTDEGDVVMDPFAGTSSTGVAALMNNRKYIGCEIVDHYIDLSVDRLNKTIKGEIKYRPADKPIYEPKSNGK